MVTLECSGWPISITDFSVSVAVGQAWTQAPQETHSDDRNDWCMPGETRLPAEAIRNTLEDLGYRMDRIKMDDGCYEARAVNDSGIPIEVRYHPVTGELVRAKLRS